MKAVGIIAEYNPFHNGHAWQIAEAKRMTGADFAVIIMSPDFVQRGEPAILDKYSRTRMALENGADLVLELPVCYACSSAEYFAEGAVALLDRLGCISALSFGCEDVAPENFSRAADFLIWEPEAYRLELLRLQKAGLTYPKAREAAIRHAQSCCPEPSFDAGLLASPNNILAVEYTKALKKRNSSISIQPVQRAGAGYHSMELKDAFCSASAVRAIIRSEGSAPDPFSASSPEFSHRLAGQLPKISQNLLERALGENALADLDDFSGLLHYRLLTDSSYSSCLDVSADLALRIRNLLPRYVCISDFVRLLKTRQLTEARVRRCLMHILLGITSMETEDWRTHGTAFYARILGFRKTAVPLLHEIKSSSEIPLISKLADAKNILDSSAYRMLTQDINASHIYQLPCCSRTGQQIHSEYTCSPIIAC